MSKNAIKIVLVVMVGVFIWECSKQAAYAVHLIDRGINIGMLPVMGISLCVLTTILFVTKSRE